MTHTDRPWRLAALVPLPEEVVRGVFAPDLDLDIVVPADRGRDAALDAVGDADILLGDYSGALRVDAELVAAAPLLAFVQQPAVGLDSVDLAACTAAGVPVANCAGSNAVPVAEWCLMATLAVLRGAAWADARVREGAWPQDEVLQRGCHDLAGKRVGLVGYGDIARAAASRFAAFDCDVSYWSRRVRTPDEAPGVRYRPLDELIETSDVLVVLVALAPETEGLISAERLVRLPQGAVVVNAARGPIVDEAGLVAELDSGHLMGAALDVFATEPLPAESSLRHDKILLSPHLAGGTLDARTALIAATVGNLRRAVTGEPVLHVQNGLDPMIRRRLADRVVR